MRTKMRLSPRALAALAGGTGLLAGADAVKGQDQREFISMPPAMRLPARTSPPFNPADGPAHRQVNVNAQGLNIVGDAANESSIAIDATAPNRIAIGWRQFDSISSDFRQAGRAYSRDGGRSWTMGTPLDAGFFRSDPVLRSDAEGRIYYCSLGTNPYRTFTFVSTDGGATFSPGFPAGGLAANDKQWLAIDRTGGPGHGNLYQHWSISLQGSRSVNNGLTWSSLFNVGVWWGTSDIGPGGEWYAAGRGDTAETGRLARAAVPWGASLPVFTQHTMPLATVQAFNSAGPNPAGICGQAQVCVDKSGGPRHGWVYMLVSGARGGDPADVWFNRSTDGGQTWLPTPVRINNDAPGAWQWFGTMSVAPNGRIDVIWNDTRESQQVNLSRLYYAYSTDGGTTWLGQAPQGPQWNSHIGWPQQNKIGDYYDMASDRVGVSVAYAATYNGEQDVYFLRINDYDCNSNGVPDAQDLAAGLLHDCDEDGVPDECEVAAGEPVVCVCYANCDGSTQAPALNVADFTCFLQRFAAGESYANCDGSTQAPVLNVADFTCFLQRFAAGCP